VPGEALFTLPATLHENLSSRFSRNRLAICVAPGDWSSAGSTLASPAVEATPARTAARCAAPDSYK
jgi:hypothetical protein